MKKLLVILISLVLIPLTPATATTKVCSYKKVNTVKNGFVCKKVGYVYRWTQIPKPITNKVEPTPIKTDPAQASKPIQSLDQVFNSQCELDKNVPEEWKVYQEFALKTFNCARPYRFVMTSMTEVKPLTKLDTDASQSISTCKIRSVRGSAPPVGFVDNTDINLSGKVNVQVVPLQFNDYKTTNSPKSDYGKYFDYLSSGFYNLSDGLTNFNFNVPDRYFDMNSNISSYSVPGTIDHGPGWVWDKQDTARYSSDIIRASDPHIDFTNVDYVFIIVPPTVPAKYVAHGGNDFNILQTGEKLIRSIYRMPPASSVDRSSWYGVEPFLHFHEIMHPIGKLDDHLGDDAGRSGPNVGTGFWGSMSGLMMDFLAWDKWTAGMMKDSQVVCAKVDNSKSYWVKPSSIFGQHDKLLVIPVSATKNIVIESMRSYGFNFKLPKSTNGALVYTVDSAINKRDYGVNVIRPSNRTGSIYSGPFILSDAALKLNDFVIVDGFKISVLESGDFGDIVKVEKL